MKPIPTLLAGLLTAAGFSAHFTADATDFRSTDIHPDGYPTVDAVKHMGTVLNKLTNGKHGIKVFNNSALGAEKDTIEQAKIGAVAMTRVNIAPMNNICPITVVPTMPFLFRSSHTPTEAQPRGFAITPEGGFLIATGQTSHRLRVSAIDPQTGALDKRSECQAGQTPNWIELVALRD